MRIQKFSPILLALFCCLVFASRAQAQHTYGYATITFDPNSNKVTGYASTELDYDTAYYYDAQVQAQIQDDNGNVYASASGSGSSEASVFMDVFDVLSCFRYTIISYVIVSPRYDLFDCGGLYDIFGFSDFPYDSWWDYGDFFSQHERCVFSNLIFLASIVASVIECLPAHVSCNFTDQVLPTGFRQGIEVPFVGAGSDKMTISCRAQDDFGSPVSGVLLRFGFDTNTVLDNGGHVGHGGHRPTGTYSRTQVRTDANGDASTQYTASAFGGTTRFTVDDPQDNHFGDIHTEVPFLQELIARDNFRLIGSTTTHPSNHWGTAAANIGLKNIADDYEAKFYLDGWPAPPQGTAIDAGDAATDYYKPHYNDQSLQDGGKFDPGANWATNGHHDEHRIGINCDVRIKNIPTDKRDDFTQIFTEEGSTRTLLEGSPPHWHLRFEFGNQQAQITANTPFSGMPVTVPGQVEAEQFDIGDAGTAFNVPDPNFNDDKGGPNVGIYTASNGTTTYVGSTMGGEWLNYTVNVISSGSYSLSAQVASPYGGSTFHFEVDGVDKTGPLYMPNTGSWEAFQLVTADDIWLDAGQHNLRLVVDGAGQNAGNFDYFFITPYTPPSSCQPTASQLGACRHIGGVWDYDACDCDSSGGCYSNNYNCY